MTKPLKNAKANFGASLFNLMMSVMEAYIKSNSNISAKHHQPRTIVCAPLGITPEFYLNQAEEGVLKSGRLAILR